MKITWREVSKLSKQRFNTIEEAEEVCDKRTKNMGRQWYVEPTSDSRFRVILKS